MSHQDWKPVVLRKTANQIKKSNTHSRGKHNTIAKRSGTQLSRELTDGESVKPKRFEKSTIRAIIQARLEQKLSQKQLAQKASLQPKLIADFEQGRLTYQPQLLNRLKRSVGIRTKI